MITAFRIHCTRVSHLHSIADERWTDSILELAAAVSISCRLENQVVDSAAGQYRAPLDSHYRRLVSMLCPSPSKQAVYQLFWMCATSQSMQVHSLHSETFQPFLMHQSSLLQNLSRHNKKGKTCKHCRHDLHHKANCDFPSCSVR